MTLSAAYAQVRAIQAALKAALVAEAGEVPVALGLPDKLQPQHIWIDGRVQWNPDYDLSNGVESGRDITFTVQGFVQAAVSYEDLLERLEPLVGAISTAAQSIAPEHVDHVRVVRGDLMNGVAADGKAKQLGIGCELVFIKWL